MSDERVRDAVIAAAEGILYGSTSIVVGCRTIVPLLTSLEGSIAQSEEARLLVAVESETDGYPVGEERKGWNAAFLAQQDEEIECYLERVRAEVEESCRRLVARLRLFARGHSTP